MRWVLIGALIPILAGCGPKDAPVQAEQHPFDLRVHDTVKQSGSDWRSWWFERDTLPSLIALAAKEYNAASIADHFDKLMLNPARLILAERCRPRVYFVSTAAGYVNALGINLEGAGLDEGRPFLLFPAVRTNVQLYDCAKLIEAAKGKLDRSKLGKRTPEAPLLPGDFVDLGELPAGTNLSFFLCANQEENVYTPVAERNPDGIPHMVAIPVAGTPYLLISYEDLLGGGDRGFEDCVFAVELSTDNVAALIGRIDPLRRVKELGIIGILALLVVGVPAGLVLFRRRVRKARLARLHQEAAELVKASHAQAALEIIERCRAEVADRRTRKEWAKLEMAAYEQLGDIANLCRLFEETPRLFLGTESASLIIARAQVEDERYEDYATLRGAWREREKLPEAWLALDADALIQQDRQLEALNLLNGERFDGKKDCGRTARLALLHAEQNLGETDSLLAHAARLDPAHPDLHVFRAAILDTQGKHREAVAAYRAALDCAPKDLYLRDRLADAHRRVGEYAQALEIWRKGLKPPSLDFVWLRMLFWSRVAQPVQVDWKAYPIPPGRGRALIEFLFELGDARFWDAKAFTPIAERQPELLSRQEVFWLRVLEALRTGADGEALSLLNLQGFGARSWHPALAIALLRILLYRRSKYLGGSVVCSYEGSAMPAPDHPFFTELDRWTQHEGIDVPEDAQRFLRSAHAFPAAFFAAGWREAALKLLRTVNVSPDLPDWLRRDIAEALRSGRSDAPEAR